MIHSKQKTGQKHHVKKIIRVGGREKSSSVGFLISSCTILSLFLNDIYNIMTCEGLLLAVNPFIFIHRVCVCQLILALMKLYDLTS